VAGYRIAFVKFGGLSAGGTERWLQMMAANVDRDRFAIDYYYCDAAPYVGSDYRHPTTDPHRLKYMQDAGVNLVEFKVGFKDITSPVHTWIDTNFWDVFECGEYDLVQTAKAGHPEYPYVEMQNRVVEYVTLSGMVDNSPNIAKTIHISHWSKDVWLRAGGNRQHAEVIPIPVEAACSSESFREELGIETRAVVCGFHQRNDENIASDIQLEAVHALGDPRVQMVVLGGGDRYREQAQRLGMANVHFLPHSGAQSVISKFLNTLDIYTHGRADGETFGTVLAEAMIHGAPCVSHYVKPGANAMAETIGPAGFVVGAPTGFWRRAPTRESIVADYSSAVAKLVADPHLRQRLGAAGREYAVEHYSVSACARKLQDIWLQLLEGGEDDRPR
jgi:glycosyltransferase involved in cell wall biosynthesis